MPKQIARVRNFGSLGLLSDRGSWDIPLQGLEEASNAVFFNGRIGRADGERVEQASIGEDNYPKELHIWRQERQNILTGVSNKGILSFVGSTATSRVIPENDTRIDDTRSFHLLQSGENLIVFPSDRDPSYLTEIGGTATDVPEWPEGLRASSVALFNGHMFLGGISGVGIENSLTKIRWSDNYDQTSQFPRTWELDDTTATTGEIPLPSEFGPIVAMLPMKGRLYVYTTRAVFEVLPASLAEVFTVRILFSDDGALNNKSVINIEGEQFVVGSRDIYIHNGQSKRTVADKKVRDLFYGSVRGNDSVFVGFSPERSEVLVCHSDTSTSTDANIALRFEYRLNAWTRSVFETPLLGVANGQVNTKGITYDDNLNTYDESDFSYGQASSAATSPITVGIDNNGNFVVLNAQRIETGTPTADMILQHTHLDFDSLVGNKGVNRVLRLTRIIPQIEARGENANVRFIVRGRQQPEGSIEEEVTPVEYVVGTDHKVDVRVSGRYFDVTILSSDPVIVDSLDFELEAVSRR